jgi:hypothetical protein
MFLGLIVGYLSIGRKGIDAEASMTVRALDRAAV